LDLYTFTLYIIRTTDSTREETVEDAINYYREDATDSHRYFASGLHRHPNKSHNLLPRDDSRPMYLPRGDRHASPSASLSCCRA
jgi:hypothetical protein